MQNLHCGYSLLRDICFGFEAFRGCFCVHYLFNFLRFVLIKSLFVLVTSSLFLMLLSSLGRWRQELQCLWLSRSFQRELRRRKLFTSMALLKYGN